MKIPSKIKGTLTEADVVSAINLLIVQGKPTPMCCAGAICVNRTISPLFPKMNFDVHYTKVHISIKQEHAITRYWSKDKSAHAIDRAYDTAFAQALVRFGDPKFWFPIRKKIEKFILKPMKPFIGQEFSLTQKTPIARPGKGVSKDIDPETGKHTGSSTKAIQCHITRAEEIYKSLENHTAIAASV